MKIRKGDLVEVLAGKEIGKQGEVIRVIPKRDRAIVDGINLAKKHQQATRETMQGGIIDKEMSMHLSNLAIVCPEDGPVRAGFRFSADGEKVRICNKCGADL